LTGYFRFSFWYFNSYILNYYNNFLFLYLLYLLYDLILYMLNMLYTLYMLKSVTLIRMYCLYILYLLWLIVFYRSNLCQFKRSLDKFVTPDGLEFNISNLYKMYYIIRLFVNITQQTRMNRNELKWIQIFRNIDSRMLKWMLFLNPECIHRNCMEYISIPFNLKIILAFSVHNIHIVNIVQFKIE